ncbi:RNA-directed DNA polymerase from mobile element jockey [Trichonephila clavipes]|nr:RNA-directed DNA polymerase from mobile element jockey [Trichonephila clavipes]
MLSRPLNILAGFQDRKSTEAVFLDIQKAFDRVWHVGLLYKLIKINTPPHLIKLINSFLKNRSFTVKVNNTHSSNRRIIAGTPQGSSISPILFNIYVNDIPRTSQSTICMFADDTAILAQSNELQLVTHFLHKHIAKLEDWFSTWKIALNVAKTEAVFFSHHIRKEPPKLYLHNTHIPWSKNTKYLGVILNKRLTFKQHIIRIRRNFNISLAKVFPLIARKSCLSLRNKLIIYKLVLRPVLQYASPIWGHAAYSNIKILETAQNKILKIITDSPCKGLRDKLNPCNHPAFHERSFSFPAGSRTERKERRKWMTRKRVENREGSLGYPRFMKPMFTKDSKTFGKRSLGHLVIVTPVLT